MKPIAIFRFSPTEGPGYFAQWLDAHALPWQMIAVDEGASIPADPRNYSGIGMMGGPMSTYDALAWVEPLSQLLRDGIARGVPVIGHCLGGQLLAQSLGARVTRTRVPEIGWFDVEVSDAAASLAWFGGLARFKAFQWHFDVFDIPAGATRVLTNVHNPNQAFIVAEKHIGFQCHVEMTQSLVESWCDGDEVDPPPPEPAVRQSRQDMLDGAPRYLAALNAVADVIYSRWAQGLAH